MNQMSAFLDQSAATSAKLNDKFLAYSQTVFWSLGTTICLIIVKDLLIG